MANPRKHPQNVDEYLTDGCGRCKFGGTPECKVNAWRDVLKALRSIVLKTGLSEDVKWSMPVYTDGGKNILAIAAFKNYASISFFKGALLKDEQRILTSSGESSQSFRLIRFTSEKEVVAIEPLLRAYVLEAVDIERAGGKISYKKIEAYDIPEEFERRMNKDAALRQAFQALTPGRQRGYLIYFSSAKQEKTRESRIDNGLTKIFAGKGLND